MSEEWRPFRASGEEAAGAPLLLTCEHASYAWPPGFACDGVDDAWLKDHYGWDPGAERLVRVLSTVFDAPTVCATFSRLFVDANRAPNQGGFIRASVEGQPLRCNQELCDQGYEARRAIHEGYHQGVAAACERLKGRHARFLLLGVHSFTPQLGESCRRHIEVGLLHDEANTELAERLAIEVRAQGLGCVLNEPYSGMDGLVYAAARHGQRFGVPYLVAEVRSDLLQGEPEALRRISEGLGRALAPILEGLSQS